MYNTTCSFTGHRPMRFSFGYDEEDEKCVRLKQVMEEQVRKLIHSGVTTFYSGMALGVDQWGYQIVAALKHEFPQLHLVAVRPCDSQADKWSVEQREKYFDMLPLCDEEVLISYDYTSTCMYERNDYLVEHADYLLAVYDGGSKGGTAYTVRKAREKDRQIIVIHPDTLEVLSPVDYNAMEQRKKLRLIPGKDGESDIDKST